MGWSLGYDSNWNRDIGYGVPCVCDHPQCDKKIDRGIAYVCGGEPYGGDRGCGLYFCSEHLDYCNLCSRCRRSNKKGPYDPKPDVVRWIKHKLEAEGKIADSLDVQMTLIKRFKAGEITFDALRAELKSIQRNAKKNGKITRA